MGRFDDRMTGQDSTRVPVITCGYMLVPLSEIRATGRIPGLGRDRVRNLLSMRGQPTEDLKHTGLKQDICTRVYEYAWASSKYICGN